MMKVVITFLIGGLLNVVLSETSDEDSYTKYRFRFDTGDIGHHTRFEESDAPGHVSGMYSYIDPNGLLRTVRYNSAPGVGYQVYGDEITKFVPELKPDASMEDHPAVPPVKTAASGEEISTDASSFSKSQIEKDSIGSEIFEGKKVSAIPQVIEENLVAENATTMTSLQSFQSMRNNDSEDVTYNSDSNKFVTKSIAEVSETDMPSSESILMIEGINNDSLSLLIDNANSSFVEPSNYTSTENQAVTEVPNTESLPASTSVYVNHNRLFPYLFPFNSFKLPVNSLPLVYAFPNAFTYNILAPHYQLIL